MKTLFSFILVLVVFSSPASALSKKEVKEIIKQAYPGARISEIEKETFQGQNVHEVDFRHDGQKLEAIISLEGEIIKVDIDD